LSLLVGGIALALLILGKIFLKHKPVALFVVIGGITAAWVLSLETRGGECQIFHFQRERNASRLQPNEPHPTV
jgi:MFS superfamily sulfate permease-like transporter